MLFDDTARHGAIDDLFITNVAEALGDHLREGGHTGADEHWRTQGYRFARALAQGARSGRRLELVRAFIDGMRTYGNEQASIGAPEFYDIKRADVIEEKAEKLLALATHKGTGSNEATAAALGFAKLFVSRELVILARERYASLGRALSRMQETINFIKREHPTIFTWAARDERPNDC